MIIITTTSINRQKLFIKDGTSTFSNDDLEIYINRDNYNTHFLYKKNSSDTNIEYKVHFEIQDIPNIYYTNVTPNPTPNSDEFLTLKTNEITATII